ncbi:pyridoxal phosphate-dependent aminotransferase [Cellulomonas carbonis]|uniref:Aminotransferase n=1 Tax=Cellulomonas carbonis T26 TaxID=947969 RepID=A0A0A0BPD4_9CELL|nr:aminotransferase class I/II-fold pyridoxal phosphate-dependent enzyme [Cellulomonas carbonis]KGM09810.1 aspartate aminotransferase [Cellulomonas carbonis T26]GGC01839.1 aminotransferase [Cellulomonas carbonis]
MKVSRRSQVPPFAVMQVLAAANARRAAGEPVISLCAGQPTAGAPAPVREAARQALADGDLGYTEAVGTPALRLAIAEHYGRWYGVDVDPARVAVTTGSSGAFLLAFLAAFEPGDRVLLARPGYPAYRNILVSLGVEVVEVACGPESRYQPTTAHLTEAYYAGGLDGVVLASPANPTGTMVDADGLAAIADWCAEYDVRLVSDEIYHGITYGEGAQQQATAARYGDAGAVVVSSFSKYWAMTGWRLGWLVLPPDLVPAVDALAGNLALCPPALAQHAALAALTPEAYAECDALVAGYAATRELLLRRLPELGWRVAPPDGAFYLYADVGTDDSVAWCERLLADTGVALTPGTDFDPVDGHRWVRLSFAASTPLVDEAVTRIAAWRR